MFIGSIILLAAVIVLILNVKPLRRKLISKPLLNLYRQVMPSMSRTEKEALEAGSVWWEGELFSGKPKWEKLLAYPEVKLTAEEQAFLDGPTEVLCGMINDWEIIQQRKDLPPEVWQFVKTGKFMGLIIPKEFGGLGFSPYAFGRIVEKLFSCGVTIGTTVGVPNSLGPAELLLHYGTEAQKKYYLPRLAAGEEIPCFALTSPEAGSDAGAMPDFGIVCRGMHDGKEVVGIRLTFDKRYITFAPIATLIGLAFKLYDPERLLGSKEDLGITCALIPHQTPGVEVGRRHNPGNNPFQNGPVRGKDVFIPVDWIIGGAAMAGHGWRMLMECLAAGRAVCLPASGVAAAKIAAQTTGAYARVRKQFNLPIGYFEGVEEALTRIAGKAYWSEAAYKFTLGALNSGEAPPIPSAILKYHLTEVGRQTINEGMDVQAGKAVILGPKNYLANGYHGAPIGVTVEGANILTRTMIIFGQGAIRCHPYVLQELHAAQDPNPETGLQNFDAALFGHLRFTCRNFLRTFILSISGAYGVSVPTAAKPKRYYQQLTRYSAAFALCADLAMFTLGGELKRREKLSARLGDVLSELYLLSAVLKRFADEGYQTNDLPLLQWSCEEKLFHIQTQLDGLLCNFPNKIVAGLLRILVFPWGRCLRPANDKLGKAVASILLTPSASLERLLAGIYQPTNLQHERGILRQAFLQVAKVEAIEKKVHSIYKKGLIKGFSVAERVKAAQANSYIDASEAQQLLAFDELRRHIISVDDFDKDLK